MRFSAISLIASRTGCVGRRSRRPQALSIRAGGVPCAWPSPSMATAAPRILLLAGLPGVDQVQRPLLGLVVQAAEVFADQAQRDQLHAAEEQDHRHHRRPAGDRVAPQQRLDARSTRRRAKASSAVSQAEVGRHAQGRGREAGDAFEREVPQPPEVELAAPAPRAARGGRGSRRWLKPTQPNRPFMKRWRSRSCRSAASARGDSRRKSPVSAGIGVLRQAADHAIERMRGRALEPALAFALQARAVDVVVAFAPLGDELRDQLRRILAVGIEDQRGAVVDMVQARGQRSFLAEVARQPQQADARDRLRPIAAGTAQVASRLPSSTYSTRPSTTVLRQPVQHRARGADAAAAAPRPR